MKLSKRLEKREKSLTYYDLIRLVRTLRRKCPWDRRQNLKSLKNNLIEEAYEFADAVERDNFQSIQEEIGDILFLGIFLAIVFEEKKQVSLNKLIKSIISKYRRKYPHVFKRAKLKTTDDVLKFWQRSKKDIYEGISMSLPSLLAARIIQERAARFGFDWDSQKGPEKKIVEELTEIRKASKSRKIFEEIGDLLFSCVNLARHLQTDPEDALRYANKKFVERFRRLKKYLEKKGKRLENSSLKEMDIIWDRLKSS